MRVPTLPAQWRGPLAIGLAGVGIVLLLLFLNIFRTSSGWGYDFAAYYDAANRLQSSGSPYQQLTLSGPYRPGPGGLYLYSPALALLLVPIADLPFDIATVLWIGFRFVLLIAACALMPVSRNIRLAIFGIAAVTPPALEDLNLGNVSVIVTFLAVVVWRFLDRPISGVALAASVLLRPTRAVVGVWWILRRRLKPAFYAALTLGLIVLASLPFVGVRGWLDYVTVLRNVSDVTGVPRNFDMASLALRLGAPSWVVTGLLVGGFAIAVVAVLLSLRRDRDLGFVVTIGASLLLSPLLWNHYMTHLLIPAAFLASRGRWWGLALPLLTWLPQELLGFVAVAATLLPFAARDALQATGGTRRDAGDHALRA
jgi:hypothetical protein